MHFFIWRLVLKQFYLISVFIVVVIVLCGCVKKDYFNPSYGFKDQYPGVYSQHYSECSSFALKRFPYRQPPHHPGYNHPACGRGGIGNAVACGDYMYDVDRQYEMALNDYKRHNYARDSAVHSCMSRKGWYVKEVPSD